MAAAPGSSLTLACAAEGRPAPALVWLAPGGRLRPRRPEPAPGCEPTAEELLLPGAARGPARLGLLPNGSLVVQEFGHADRGDYICFVDNGFGNDSVSFHLDLKFEYRNVLYYWSILFGFVAAVAFLGRWLVGVGSSDLSLTGKNMQCSAVQCTLLLSADPGCQAGAPPALELRSVAAAAGRVPPLPQAAACAAAAARASPRPESGS
jgi:hypothetical protein